MRSLIFTLLNDILRERERANERVREREGEREREGREILLFTYLFMLLSFNGSVKKLK